MSTNVNTPIQLSEARDAANAELAVSGVDKTARHLVVDLDGTLIQSDMLYETFWDYISNGCRSPIQFFKSTLNGRSSLKRFLARSTNIDVKTLPFNRSVLDYLADWKMNGGSTALVTASDQLLADQIAEHVGLFDEVYGSDGAVNLKGIEKASFLREKYGDNEYVYVGDSNADLHVWKESRSIVTVNAAKALHEKIFLLGKPVEKIETPKQGLIPYLKAIRPHQWMKNVLVFLPLIAAHNFSSETIAYSVAAMIAFSLVASSAYVLNDLLDLQADRQHPKKRFRPFASGDLSLTSGTWLVPGLLLSGTLVGSFVGLSFVVVLLAYCAITVLYSLYLKRQTILDIFTLAGLYTMRIVAGGIATGISLSVWLLAFSIFFFFSLASIKRQAELTDMRNRGLQKAKGRGYQVADLPLITNMALCSGYVSVLVLGLYINSVAALQLYGHPEYLWGICGVLLYWISRMSLVTHRGGMHHDPIVYATKDWVSQFCLLLIVGIALLSAYL